MKKILQAIYTSCTKGQSSSSGFQFYSYSDGLTSEELLEIEKRGLYNAPDIGISNPTQEDIKKYPINFSYFRLKSGRCGVLQSAYLGKDYSGRLGNYIVHAFVLENGEFDFEPIHLYQSKSFKTGESHKDWDINEVPEKLKPLDLESLYKNPEITAKKASDFLKGKDSVGNFAKLINAIIENSENKRDIILSADFNDAANWIAAMSFALPKKLVQSLTFSTYSMEPQSANVIVRATLSEGSRFNFNDHRAVNFQYYIFNFGENKVSPMEHEAKYSVIANDEIKKDDSGVLRKFSEFVDQYNYNAVSREIDIVWKLFKEQAQKTKLSNETLTFFFKYAKDKTKDAFWKEPSNITRDVCEFALSQGMGLDDLYRRIKENKIPKQFVELMPFFLEKLDNAGKKGLFEGGAQICAQDKECQKQLLKCYIPTVSDKNEILSLIFFASNNEHIEFLPELIKKLEEKGAFEEFGINDLERVVSIMESLNLPANDSELVFFVKMQKIKKLLLDANPQVRDDFMKKSENLPIKVCKQIFEKAMIPADKFYACLLKNKHIEQLVALMPGFLANLKNDDGKRKMFEECISLCTLPEHKEYEKQIFDSYSRAVKSGEKLVELIFWAEKHKLRERLPELIATLEANTNPFEGIRNIENLKKIAAYKEKLNIPKGKLEMFLLTKTVERLPLKEINEELRKNIKFISQAGKIELDKVFETVISKISESNEYEYVFSFLESDELRELFAEKLVLNCKNDVAVIRKMIKFVLALPGQEKKHPNASKWANITVQILGKMKEKLPEQFKTLDKQVSKSEKMAKGWKELKNGISNNSFALNKMVLIVLAVAIILAIIGLMVFAVHTTIMSIFPNDQSTETIQIQQEIKQGQPTQEFLSE